MNKTFSMDFHGLAQRMDMDAWQIICAQTALHISQPPHETMETRSSFDILVHQQSTVATLAAFKLKH